MAIKQKVCRCCNTEKPLEEFHKNKNTTDGYMSRCAACDNTIAAKYERENKDRCNVRHRKNRAEHKATFREFKYQYLLKHSCVDCGESDPVVLEFDHILEKKYAIAKMHYYTLERINAEIAKCQVRCANCHRRRTLIENGDWKAVRHYSSKAG
jgi:hypothetical protein